LVSCSLDALEVLSVTAETVRAVPAWLGVRFFVGFRAEVRLLRGEDVGAVFSCYLQGLGHWHCTLSVCRGCGVFVWTMWFIRSTTWGAALCSTHFRSSLS